MNTGQFDSEEFKNHGPILPELTIKASEFRRLSFVHILLFIEILSLINIILGFKTMVFEYLIVQSP